MPAVIVNLASIPPADPVPGLATGGTSAAGMTTNGATPNNPPVALDPSGVPISSNVLPSATPVVTTLPAAGDPLAVVNQYVIFQGKPYIYTAGIFGGADYWALDVTSVPSIRDVWANLSLYPAANYPVGTVFVASDRGVSYAVQQPGGVNTWIYYNGISEAPLADIPTDLDDTSRGFIFRASDYLHNWIWDAGWSLTTGGIRPGSFFDFASPGLVPSGDALWQLCDGSTVPVSQDDATLVNYTTPVFANRYLVR